MIRWFADRLRRFADRIDRDGAPKGLDVPSICVYVPPRSMSFTFERNVGIKYREDGRGCRLWYLCDADYMRAFTEADDPVQRINWSEMRYYTDDEMRST